MNPAKRKLFNSSPSGEPPEVDQDQAAIYAENHPAHAQEQHQTPPEVPAQPNAEPAPAPTSHSEPGVDQDQAAINAENHPTPAQEQHQTPPEVAAQPNADSVPAPTSHSESSAMGDEEDKPVYKPTDTDMMWMKVALTVASRAEIPEYVKEKPSVGCVIRRSRSKGPPGVLAVGWNGFLPKTPEKTLKDKAAEYDRKGKKHRLTKELGLHAETNALRNCSENPEKATVYVTHVPCYDCAKQLVAHRVKRVFYLFWMDRSESSIKLFQDFDISCIPFPGSNCKDVLRDFSEGFLDGYNILAGSTTLDKAKKGSFYRSTNDSTSDTSDLKRSVSGDY